MTVTLCDKCKKEIKIAAEDSGFYIQLEEWKNSNYVDTPIITKRYQLCVDCYRDELNQLY